MFCMFYTHTTNKKTMFHAEIIHIISPRPWSMERYRRTHTTTSVCSRAGCGSAPQTFSTCDIYTQQNDHDNSKYSRTSIHTAGREYCRAGGCSAPQRNTRAAQRPADRSEFLKSRIPTKSTVSNNYGVATVSRID